MIFNINKDRKAFGIGLKVRNIIQVKIKSVEKN